MRTLKFHPYALFIAILSLGLLISSCSKESDPEVIDLKACSNFTSGSSECEAHESTMPRVEVIVTSAVFQFVNQGNMVTWTFAYKQNGDFVDFGTREKTISEYNNTFTDELNKFTIPEQWALTSGGEFGPGEYRITASVDSDPPASNSQTWTIE